MLALHFSNKCCYHRVEIDPVVLVQRSNQRVGDCLESIDGVKVTKKEDLEVGKDRLVR